MNPLDEDLVLDALRGVVDPEAGLNIVDLGLVYGVEVAEGHVKLLLTMTSAACPMADMIVDDVHATLERALPEGTGVEVEMVWDPPWTPDRMSGIAREQFGWMPK